MITFPFELTDDEKLNMLFTYYRIDPIKVDDEDKAMVVMALTREDVATVRIDEEGGLMIEYYE